MKIIDLLNKIANGEEVPYRIKYNGRIYEYAEEIKWYLRDDMKSELSNSKKRLNDEVEILEETPIISKLYINNELQYDLEEKKTPEKIKTLKHSCNFDRHEEILYENQVDLANKITEILDYLKSKGDE